jgi:cation transport regulator ChaC
VATWLFGYGSLIWRPDIAFLERRVARAGGWVRRFWQGSHDHRGLPHDPGRVVTLVPEPRGACEGMAYLIEDAVLARTFSYLDHREKNGYERHALTLGLRGGESQRGVVYIASHDNHAFLGPAPLHDIAAQIHRCAGPSGRNVDYLLELARSLREHDIHDPHVFELEAKVAALIEGQPASSDAGRDLS